MVQEEIWHLRQKQLKRNHPCPPFSFTLRNAQPKEVAMSQLVAVEFHDEHTAFAVRAELAKMQKEYLIDMKDVVVVTKD